MTVLISGSVYFSPSIGILEGEKKERGKKKRLLFHATQLSFILVADLGSAPCVSLSLSDDTCAKSTFLTGTASEVHDKHPLTVALLCVKRHDGEWSRDLCPSQQRVICLMVMDLTCHD